MSFRRFYVSMLVASTLVACGPSEEVQTVAFLLDIGSERLEQVEFTARFNDGRFTGDDGGCVAGSSVAPGRFAANATVVVTPQASAAAPNGVAITTTSTSSTSSTSTTTTTSTTTSTTSTTTTLPSAQTCTLTFRMTSAATIGSLQWETDYQAAPGEIAGEGADVDCTSLVSGALPAFNDNDATRVVSAGLISLAGFTGPLDISECTFRGESPPATSDFVITLNEAVSPDFEPIDPAPQIVLQSIECEGTVTTTTMAEGTTTTSTTTTTMVVPGVCGNGVVNSGERCDDGNTVSGDGCSSTCDLQDLFTSIAEPGQLSVQLVHEDGIPPGATLAFCRFQGDASAANFAIQIFSCQLAGGGTCTPVEDAVVSVSTTTTTTTTTTSTSSTTSTTRGVVTTSTLF